MKTHDAIHQLETFLFTDRKKGMFFHTAPQKSVPSYSYLFLNPEEVIATHRIADVPSCFGRIQKLVDKGLYVAGYLAYEAGYAFDVILQDERGVSPSPVLYFCAYKKPHIFKNIHVPQNAFQEAFILPYTKPNITKKKYVNTIKQIRAYLASGDVYQVNYCFKLQFPFLGNSGHFFSELCNTQPVQYAACIKHNALTIVSQSPELFFKIVGRNILLKPMKGTVVKSGDDARDRRSLSRFKQSKKNKAENLMIVDLIRNDCSKIAKKGSVRVPILYEIEEYKTLYQMTSSITAHIRDEINVYDIFRALFPCGSVTGAPKIRSMQIIDELEKEKRGVYTGAIGFIAPRMETACFSIPIRTAVICNKDNRGELGVGSGVVIDSHHDKEYEECIGKAKYLTKLTKRFYLFETMLFDGRRYTFLDEHVKRLEGSAKNLGFLYDVQKIKQALSEHAQRYKGKRLRVRILLYAKGRMIIESDAIKKKRKQKQYVSFANEKMNSQNVYLKHKTSNRAWYARAYEQAKESGLFDHIFLNEKGEVTEGAISNIFIKKRGTYYTPPLCAGLLPGVYRGILLRKDPQKYKEKKLYMKDIIAADAIYMCNSVRGMMRVYIKNV